MKRIAAILAWLCLLASPAIAQSIPSSAVFISNPPPYVLLSQANTWSAPQTFTGAPVLMNSTATWSASTTTPFFQIGGTTNSTATEVIDRYSADAGAPSFFFYKSHSGSIGTESAVQTNDVIEAIQGIGSDGTTVGGIVLGTIQLIAESNATTGSGTAGMAFKLRNGASGPAQVLFLDPSGNVDVGPSFHVIADVNGNIFAVQETVTNGTIIGGTAPTLTGTCTTGSKVGGATAGSFTATCTAQTVIISLPTSPHGWVCTAQDQTTSTDTMKQTAGSASTTSCTLTGTTVASDVIVWYAVGF